MHRCPQCTKPLPELTRRCPSCQADLDLLVDLAGQMRGKLDRAEAFTRQGELANAVWAYLEVLEADPGNPSARKQVAHVATAVRQFDLSTPARRWASGMPAPESWWEKHGKIATAAIASLALGLLMGLMVGKSGRPSSNALGDPQVESTTDGKADPTKGKEEPKTKDGKTETKDKSDPKDKKLEPKIDTTNADPKDKKAPDLSGFKDPPMKVLDRPKLGTPEPKE